jgi:hypothetical protein
MLNAHSSNVYKITLEGPATGNSTPKKQAISLDERAYKTGEVGGVGANINKLWQVFPFSQKINIHLLRLLSLAAGTVPYTESVFYKH